MIDTYTIQEIVDMAKCSVDRTKKLVFVEQARKELKKRFSEKDNIFYPYWYAEKIIDEVL